MDLKPVTVQKVSAVLRKANLRRSTSHATAVKGYRNHSEGYEVSKGYPEGVYVDYTLGSWGSRNTDEDRRQRALVQVFSLLEQANIVCKWSDGHRPCVVCLRLKNQQ